MKHPAIKCFTLLSAILLVQFSMLGQGKAPGGISGIVKDDAAGVPYAVVSLPEIGVSAITDENGNYSISGLSASEYEVSVSCLGYETINKKVKVGKTSTKVDFIMKVADFRLDDVTVTATASKTGAATASKISRTAIEHMQANSLYDVMALLPGADITDNSFVPDLQGVKSMTIRGGQAMGTSIVMDGAPLSNNANMQTMSAAIGSATTGAGGVAPASGIDLRTITTDNVESVEVIRGVASVEYGNATSGTVIVNSKAGKEPLTVKFNTNPNIYSASATHGVGLGKDKGFLNYGLDYAYSVQDPREGYDNYQRTTARLSYSNTFFKKLSTTTTASFIWTKDKGEPNPDDDNDFQTKNSRSYGARFTTSGTLDVSKGWFKNIKYNLAFNYTDRLSYFSDQGVNADVAYSFSKVDGSVLSSIKGQKIYDEGGKEITNFGSSLADSRSWMTPANYQYEYNVYGKEINTFAKLVANFAGKIGATNHKLIFGADFDSDGNVGEGKVFDYDIPPYRSVSYTFATQRERAFKDIPFLNRGGLFAEETFRANILNRELKIVAGARYDYVFGLGKGAAAPRINASYELIPNVLSIRGAYGVNVKTPGLAYVYPDKAYFDMVNFNNANSSKVADGQKFQVITTHVYDVDNSDLELAKVAKKEVGFDLSLGRVNLSVTAFQDLCNNGYSFSTLVDNYKYVTYNKYVANTYNADGVTLPALALDGSASQPYFLEYTSPANNNAYERKGIEFVLDFGRIDAIRTSFLINGEYFEYSTWNNGVFLWNKSGIYNSDLGVYNRKISNGIDKTTDFITNFVITHNIPQIGLVISMTANVNWNYKSWTEYGAEDDIPVQYLSIADGKCYDFNKSWIADPTSATYAQWLPILHNEANGAISSIRRDIEPAYNPALCINTNVTKQFDKFSVSFFANNMFRSTPLQPLKKSPGSFKRRNAEVFFFGLQLSAKLF